MHALLMRGASHLGAGSCPGVPSTARPTESGATAEGARDLHGEAGCRCRQKQSDRIEAHIDYTEWDTGGG
jgi:hypothetical protein